MIICPVILVWYFNTQTVSEMPSNACLQLQYKPFIFWSICILQFNAKSDFYDAFLQHWMPKNWQGRQPEGVAAVGGTALPAHWALTWAVCALTTAPIHSTCPVAAPARPRSTHHSTPPGSALPTLHTSMTFRAMCLTALADPARVAT